MKHIISLSGGIGSYFTLKRVIEKGISKEDIECIFCDTLNENGDLYRFLDDIEENLISGLSDCVLVKHHTHWLGKKTSCTTAGWQTAVKN